MSPDDFAKLVDDVMEKVSAVLTLKEKEYSEGVDRLDQFKKGSLMLGIPPHKVLAGYMNKHTTSLYDMLKTSDTTKYPMGKWDEKIIDHINYLLLLVGILEENQNAKNAS